MERASSLSEEEEQIELPPGFRFHPTDEELITHYLSPKILDDGFRAQAIGEVDLNKWEPWELPCKLHASNQILITITFCFTSLMMNIYVWILLKGELKWVKKNGTSSI